MKQIPQVLQLVLPGTSKRIDQSEADICVSVFKDLMESLEVNR